MKKCQEKRQTFGNNSQSVNTFQGQKNTNNNQPTTYPDQTDPDIIRCQEPKKNTNPPEKHKKAVTPKGHNRRERAKKSEDNDDPKNKRNRKIFKVVKIVGAITCCAGVIAGSATTAAIGAAVVGGAVLYDQIREE